MFSLLELKTNTKMTPLTIRFLKWNISSKIWLVYGYLTGLVHLFRKKNGEITPKNLHHCITNVCIARSSIRLPLQQGSGKNRTQRNVYRSLQIASMYLIGSYKPFSTVIIHRQFNLCTWDKQVRNDVNHYRQAQILCSKRLLSKLLIRWKKIDFNIGNRTCSSGDSQPVFST